MWNISIMILNPLLYRYDASILSESESKIENFFHIYHNSMLTTYWIAYPFESDIAFRSV